MSPWSSDSKYTDTVALFPWYLETLPMTIPLFSAKSPNSPGQHGLASADERVSAHKTTPVCLLGLAKSPATEGTL